MRAPGHRGYQTCTYLKAESSCINRAGEDQHELTVPLLHMVLLRCRRFICIWPTVHTHLQTHKLFESKPRRGMISTSGCDLPDTRIPATSSHSYVCSLCSGFVKPQRRPQMNCWPERPSHGGRLISLLRNSRINAAMARSIAVNATGLLKGSRCPAQEQR